MTLKQDLLDRIIIDAAKHSAAVEAAAALAAAGIEATPAEPTCPGYANDNSQAFDLAGYPFQAIVHNPVSALLKAA